MKNISVLLLFLLAAIFPGCSGFRVLPDFELRSADRFLNEKKYREAVAVYDRIAREDAGTRRGANALIAAAMMRVSPDNPNKDYGTALQQFDEFISRYPGNARIDEARQWRYFCKSMFDLKKENDALNQKIEQLKKIDIKHEEKRRRRR